MKSAKNVIISPLYEALYDVDYSKNVIISGKSGGGKTTLLKEVLFRWNESDKLLVDATLKKDEYLTLSSNTQYDLYYICLIIRKILLYINKNYPNEFSMYFEKFSQNINFLDNAVKTNQGIPEGFLNNPFQLIDELISLIMDHLGYDAITLIIDDVDRKGYSSSKLQSLLYGRLKEYFNFIVTVGNNPVSELESENQVIKIEYNSDLEKVKEILSQEAYELMLKKDAFDYRYRVAILLGMRVFLE